MTLPYALNLYNSVKRGSGFMATITDRAKNWRRTVRRIGGFWQASFEYTGNRDELDDLFFDGLMTEVRETSGGLQTWQGFVGDMTYKRGSITWRRSIFDTSNAIKALYTRQFPNLLPNGSAESGPWTVVNGATVTQSTTWVTDGTYSCKIVVADTDIRGADIITSVALLANTNYVFTINTNTVLGSWRIQINRTSDDEPVVYTSTAGALGVRTFELTIGPNQYVGNVRVRITSEANVGTFYGDGASLRIAESSADTGWTVDAASITEFGRLEQVLLSGAMSTEAAQAQVATLLQRTAWPRLLAPEDFGGDVDDTDSLAVSCYGYVYTLPWAINTTLVEATASAIVTSLATGRDYVASSRVDTNALLFAPDNQFPISVWQVLKTLVNSGDGSANLWALGMYADRALVYEQFSSTIAYIYRNGRLYNPAGGEMEPWLTLPGWASLDDAPLVPYQTLTAADDPRRVIVEEVEFLSPDVFRFRSKVID